MSTASWRLPPKQGLYDPANEHEACGVGFICSIEGAASHSILQHAAKLSQRMEHRGACSADNDTGDGAGVLVAMPHGFYFQLATLEGVSLPPLGRYASGVIFTEESFLSTCKSSFERLAAGHGLITFWWRSVPRDNSCLGQMAKDTEPVMVQVFVKPKDENMQSEEFIRKVYLLRKTSTHIIGSNSEGGRYYICSLSASTVVYKGQFNPCQLWQYFDDLKNPDMQTHICIVHTRFSTNTFPSWERAHPYRVLAHNGEINTLRGNVNLMKAREGVMANKDFGDELTSLYPVVEPDMSDSGSLDNVLEFLVMAGNRTLPEAVMTMVPEAWQNDALLPDYKKDFYGFAACCFEPWDGPALITFSDGRYVGAVLDRNGLRPSRYYVTSDNLLVMSSEVGVFDAPANTVVQKGRLKPGRMLLVDTLERSITKDEELKRRICESRPHADWWQGILTLEGMRRWSDSHRHLLRQPTVVIQMEYGGNPDEEDESYEHNNALDKIFQDENENDMHNGLWFGDLNGNEVDPKSGLKGHQMGGHRDYIVSKIFKGDRRMPLFGYTLETVQMLLVPMLKTQKEALGSMGNDAPFACLSDMQPLIYEYFKQLFAQVTNPPIDPFREKIVMSLACPIGPEGNILEPDERTCHRLWLEQPIITPKDLDMLKRITIRGWRSKLIDITYDVDSALNLEEALDHVCREAEAAARTGQFIILSDRGLSKDRIPISALLAAGAVHHHLINTRLRAKCAIILETGEIREVHQICVAVGYGVDAICPYMVFEIVQKLREENVIHADMTDEIVFENYSAAIDRGISKVMAKMGISTMQSYKGAQIFEAVGLADEVIEKCFRGTASRIGGVSFRVLAEEGLERHVLAFGERECDSRILRDPGFLHWRSGGEKHINDPTSIALLQEATKHGNRNAYEKYVEAEMRSIRECTLRGQLELVFSSTPVSLDEVEPAKDIVRRFATGAMSFGSISLEAHSTLAVAMNRLGGKSNTGEGGENADRYLNQDPDFNMRSAIKQVASGRFGVTSSYLSHADELQIKMAQGAKPGEGGELPGHKVSKEIAATRHSVPGVGLISPPPHHDIYSIEDLGQLIYDLKCANPQARISVKLVSEVGVGVVAAGVAKGKSEHILISGHDGGTGASSWTGIKGAGLPWELGLAETHQVLTLNDLRSRVVLQTDGQLRTGFDVVVGALLGADEFGFSTVPLIVMGCTMMRKCHLNTCPVGVATQDPVLRKKFEGKPEHVVNFFFMLAEEIRQLMAKLGVKRFQDLIGRTDLLKQRKDSEARKGAMLDLSTVLVSAKSLRPEASILGGTVKQDFNLESRLEALVLPMCLDVIEGKTKTVDLSFEIVNKERTFGATISNKIALRYQDAGLPDGSQINIRLTGSAGQSFCAFMIKGLNITLEGDANDYVGKSLCGGNVVVYPPKDAPADFKSESNVIVGNACLYGATSGKAFFRGVAAERFCVRNSGAIAVVEGVGDHGCEYMTGGTVVVLGSTGRNFGAGMSGGIAYVLDVDGLFDEKCNKIMVDLVPLEEAQDEEFLQELLKEFVEKTGSQVAENILADWNTFRPKFVKVFPHEFQRVMKEKAAEEAKASLKAAEKASGRTTPEIRLNDEAGKAAVGDIEDSVRDGAAAKKKLDKLRGFVKYDREKKSYRSAKTRVNDWDEIYDFGHVRKGLRTQAARCMECGVPFCHSNSAGCPLGNIIPKFNDLVFHNNWKEALNQLLQTNNFPEFTGRVCPAPCEGACVLGINAPPVTIKNIECAIIDKAFDNGWIKASPPPYRTGKKVVIIGSGPSGLAAADQLNKAGHWVTVLERNNRIGGLLQYGIPTMKLSKAVVQRRVDLLAEEGVVFRAGVNVGTDVDVTDLRKEHDVVLFCTGATRPRDLDIDGRDAAGIHFAMEFLQAQQQAQHGDDVRPISAEGLDVVVIGGGDTGCDCIGTSLRQGAKSITSFEILPTPPNTRAADNPWPQFPKLFKVDYGHEEVSVKWNCSDPRRYNTTSKSFLKDSSGRLSGISTVLVEWTKDEKGAWRMAEVPGSEKVYPCQLALLAMGFLGPEKSAPEQMGLELDNRTNIKTEAGKFSTGSRGVFAAGDCRRGQSLVVWAITEGRQAAREVDEYLMGHSLLPHVGGVIHPKAACCANETCKG